MFHCDKGYKIKLGEPMGATCLDGRWSPDFIPTCQRENHPAIKWLDKRRKRSVMDEEDKDCPELSELSMMKYEILKTGGEGELYNSDGSTIKGRIQNKYSQEQSKM